MEYTLEVKQELIEEGKNIHLQMLAATALVQVEELLVSSDANIAKLVEFSKSGSDVWTEFDDYMLVLIIQAAKQLKEVWEEDKQWIN